MAYRQTEARLQKDGEQRQRILELALARVADGGFAALTMQSLADDAGIATGSLYRHFSGKGELAAEVFARASQREVDALGVLLKDSGSAAERLSRGLHQFAARAWGSRQLAFALIAEPVDPEVDEQRLEFEIVMLADKLDITEECVRYRSHSKFFIEAVKGPEPAGRKLGFILQEMHREITTIGSKANEPEIAHLVVQAKEELEKIREQVQNIE